MSFVFGGCCFFLMFRGPPGSKRIDTLFPYPTLFRSAGDLWSRWVAVGSGGEQFHLRAREYRRAAGRGLGRRFHRAWRRGRRSEEHTSELQSLMRISYAVFCLKKKTKT